MLPSSIFESERSEESWRKMEIHKMDRDEEKELKEKEQIGFCFGNYQLKIELKRKKDIHP